MMNFINYIITLTGWRKYFACFLLGVLATSALPPFFIFPALIISFTFFFWLLERCETKKQAFFTGWWFGFGHFVSGLYWMANSLLIEPEKFAWMIPFAVSLIPGVLAIYIGLVSLITYLLPEKISGWRRVIVFGCIWTIAEMFRATLFTGFPWNLIGYSWNFSPSVIQIASIFGIYGLSLLAIIISTIPSTLFDGEVRSTGNRKSLIIVIFIFLIIFTYGKIRIEISIPGGQILDVLIVQPNIPQKLKWDPLYEAESLNKVIKLTAEHKTKKPELVIWPEAAVPFLLVDEPDLRKRIASSIPEGSYLLLGGLRTENIMGLMNIFNSALLMDSEGNIVAGYDKHHLVPFGEFVPLRNVFPFINKITPGTTDFTRGIGPQTIKNGKIPSFSPLICYEDIFPSEVIDKTKTPEMLINITNDGWFGNSTGPYQHFEMARIRAIEENIPMIRAANTGISGIIDYKGRLIGKLGLNKEGTIFKSFPIGSFTSFDKGSLYSSFGNAMPLLLILILMMISIPRDQKNK